MNGERMSTDIQNKERVVVTLQPPKLWKVIFLNDDKTPMELVIDLLITIFKHTEMSATEVTMEIHNTGSGIAGVYTHEIAEQRVIQATNLARLNGAPLRIQAEEE
jgi:ATP-dependent Clp protease adaptor protein ClpS